MRLLAEILHDDPGQGFPTLQKKPDAPAPGPNDKNRTDRTSAMSIVETSFLV
jgi:hypothetical protein